MRRGKAGGGCGVEACGHAGRWSSWGNAEVEELRGLLVPQKRQVRVDGSLGVEDGSVRAGGTFGGCVSVDRSSLVAVAPWRAVGYLLGGRDMRVGLCASFVASGRTLRSVGMEAAFAGLGALAFAAGSPPFFGGMASDFVWYVSF